MPISRGGALLASKWGGGEVVPLGRGSKRRSDSLDSDNSQDSGGTNGYAVPAKVQKTHHPPPPPRPAGSSLTPGIIEKVYLENFMCHEKFTWEPNKCVSIASKLIELFSINFS